MVGIQKNRSRVAFLDTVQFAREAHKVIGRVKSKNCLKNRLVWFGLRRCRGPDDGLVLLIQLLSDSGHLAPLEFGDAGGAAVLGGADHGAEHELGHGLLPDPPEPQTASSESAGADFFNSPLAHRMRNLEAKVPEDLRPEFKAHAQAACQAPKRLVTALLAMIHAIGRALVARMGPLAAHRAGRAGFGARAIRRCLTAPTDNHIANFFNRPVVHFYRNVFSHLPAAKVREVSHMLKAIHAQESRSAAETKAEAVIDELRRQRLVRAAELVEAHVGETLSFYAFPDCHWIKLGTNNPLERIMREIRRRTRVVGASPTVSPA